MKNSSKIAAFFCSILLGMVGALIYANEVIYKVKPSLKNSLASTAMVSTADSMGSGTLLETGYIITAAHVVDVDEDGELGEYERIVDIGFHGRLGKETGLDTYGHLHLRQPASR